jgi:hypothetical protein
MVVSIVYMVIADSLILTINKKRMPKSVALDLKQVILYTYYSSLSRKKYTFVKTKPNLTFLLLSVQTGKIINHALH